MNDFMYDIQTGAGDMFKGLVNVIEPGCCKLSMKGNIAIKTSTGYKTYDVNTGRLVNCSNFVFDMGQNTFFTIPTNKVRVGDIIFVNRKPRCVREIRDKNAIEVLNYENSTIETIVPERHILFGKTYFYAKLVSLFGDGGFIRGMNENKLMKFMIMSQVMKVNPGNNILNMMVPLMLLGGKDLGGNFEGLFGDLFDMDDEDQQEQEDEIKNDFEKYKKLLEENPNIFEKLEKIIKEDK